MAKIIIYQFFDNQLRSFIIFLNCDISNKENQRISYFKKIFLTTKHKKGVQLEPNQGKYFSKLMSWLIELI